MKIEELDDETKKKYEVEISLFNQGVLKEEDLMRVISNDLKKQEKRNAEIKKAETRRKMENFIKLLKERPDVLSNIKTFYNYRRLRVEQRLLPIWIEEAKKDYENAGMLNISRMQDRVISLDKERRSVHNKALGNFNGLMRDYRNCGIEPFYQGEIMDPHNQKDNYGDPDIRKSMTDAMLSFLGDIEDTNINELSIQKEDYSEALGTFSQIYKDLNTQTHDYGLRRNIVEDDGDIEL